MRAARSWRYHQASGVSSGHPQRAMRLDRAVDDVVEDLRHEELDRRDRVARARGAVPIDPLRHNRSTLQTRRASISARLSAIQNWICCCVPSGLPGESSRVAARFTISSKQRSATPIQRIA